MKFIDTSDPSGNARDHARRRAGPMVLVIMSTILAACGGGGGGGGSGDATAPTPSGSPPSSVPASTPTPTAGSATTDLVPRAVPAVATRTFTLPAGTVLAHPWEATDDQGGTITFRRALLIDDAASTFVFAVQGQRGVQGPRPYQIYAADFGAASTPRIVYDALPRNADLATCPNSGVRYSITQDGQELMLPESAPLGAGSCAPVTQTRSRLLAIPLTGSTPNPTPTVVWSVDQRLASSANWIGTWNHWQVAIAADGGVTGGPSLHYVWRPGRDPATARVRPAMLLPRHDIAINETQLQIPPGGTLDDVYLYSYGSVQPVRGMLRANFGAQGSTLSLLNGYFTNEDTVTRNRGLTRTGTAVGADHRVGAPFVQGYAPVPATKLGTFWTAICQSYSTPSVLAIYGNASTAISPESQRRFICDRADASSSPLWVNQTVHAVRGDSLVLVTLGQYLYRFDLADQSMRTGRLPPETLVYNMSANGRWLVTYSVSGNQVTFALHDTDRWGTLPR